MTDITKESLVVTLSSVNQVVYVNETKIRTNDIGLNW